MPDPVTKVSFRYNGTAFFGKGSSRAPTYHTGWSEQWYYPAAVNDAALVTFIQQYVELRKAILAKNCTLISTHMTQIEGGRGTRSQRRYVGGLAKEINDFSVVVNIPVMTENFAADRIFALHGVPDEMLEDGEWQPTQAYLDLVKAFLRHISTNNWAFKGIDKSGVTSEIVDIVLNGGVYTVTTKAAHGVVGTQEVQILRTQRQADFRTRGGLIKATNLTATTASIPADWPHGECKGGRMRIVKVPHKIYFNALVDLDLVGNASISHKDPGGPFDSPRGRRPVKRA